MTRLGMTAFASLFLSLVPVLATAQVGTTGQVVGVVKDASGAVIVKADLVLIDTTTGLSFEAKSRDDGGFVFPNLQPGTYTLTATAGGFRPLTLQQIVVQTSRTAEIVVQFQVAGVTEQVNVEGRTSVVETRSATVSNTVSNEQIAKLPMSGRNILDFALLVPGATQSTGGRDSHFNGLPGGAINISLDGVNNNSARFRSGGTSMFVFAPVRLGAIEEVTVSTSGLSAEAGAEGAMQIQFVTKRGSNTLRGQVFDQYRSDKLNKNSWVNEIRGIPEEQAAPARIRRERRRPDHQGPALLLRELRADLRAGRIDAEPPRPDTRGAAGHFPLQRQRQRRADRQPAEHRRGERLLEHDRSVHRRAAADHQPGDRRRQPRFDEPVPEHVQLHRTEHAEHERLSHHTCRLSGVAVAGHPRRAEPALAGSADTDALSRPAEGQ